MSLMIVYRVAEASGRQVCRWYENSSRQEAGKGAVQQKQKQYLSNPGALAARQLGRLLPKVVSCPSRFPWVDSALEERKQLCAMRCAKFGRGSISNISSGSPCRESTKA